MRNPKYGFCGKVHAKVFEIILIFGFMIGIGTLIAYFIQTKWFIKYSDYLLYGVYGLVAINFLSLILIFILRILRCNNSVLKNQSSSSHVISIIILILILINFLYSIAEGVLYYLAISFYLGDDDDDDDDGGSGGSSGSGGGGGGGVCGGNGDDDDEDDSENNSDKENEDKCRHLDGHDIDSTNINTIVVYNNDVKSDIISIIDNTDAINNEGNNNAININSDDGNVEDDFGDFFESQKEIKRMFSILNKMDYNIFAEIAENSEKCKKLTFVPLITMNVNPFIQIISLIFIIFIIKRIKIKSNSLNESSIRNQIGSTKNVRDINDNQDDNIFKGNIKKNKKKTKNNKISKKNTTSSPNSDQLEIMNNKRNKKKQRDKKRKHKYKK